MRESTQTVRWRFACSQGPEEMTRQAEDGKLLAAYAGLGAGKYGGKHSQTGMGGEFVLEGARAVRPCARTVRLSARLGIKLNIDGAPLGCPRVGDTDQSKFLTSLTRWLRVPLSPSCPGVPHRTAF